VECISTTFNNGGTMAMPSNVMTGILTKQ